MTTESRLHALERQQKKLVSVIHDAKVGLRVLGVVGVTAIALAALVVALWNSTGGGIKGGRWMR